MDPARLRSFGFWIEESAVLAGGTQFWIVDLSPRNVITVSRYPRFIQRVAIIDETPRRSLKLFLNFFEFRFQHAGKIVAGIKRAGTTL